MYEMLHAKALI